MFYGIGKILSLRLKPQFNNFLFFFFLHYRGGSGLKIPAGNINRSKVASSVSQSRLFKDKNVTIGLGSRTTLNSSTRKSQTGIDSKLDSKTGLKVQTAVQVLKFEQWSPLCKVHAFCSEIIIGHDPRFPVHLLYCDQKHAPLRRPKLDMYQLFLKARNYRRNVLV